MVTVLMEPLGRKGNHKLGHLAGECLLAESLGHKRGQENTIHVLTSSKEEAIYGRLSQNRPIIGRTGTEANDSLDKGILEETGQGAFGTLQKLEYSSSRNRVVKTGRFFSDTDD